MDLDGVDIQQVGDLLHAVLGNVVVATLHFLQDEQQGAAVAAVAIGQRFQLLAKPFAVCQQHQIVPPTWAAKDRQRGR